MYQWKSQDLALAFEQLDEIDKVLINPPGGDVDSENLVLEIANGDKLFVAGFHTTDYDIWQKDTADVEVEMVELTDGQCGSGGLNSNNSDTAIAYVKARQILVDGGAEVVDQMNDYF